MVLVLINVRKLVLTYYLENMVTKPQKIKDYMEMDIFQAEVLPGEN